jgi:Rrf2 family protein
MRVSAKADYALRALIEIAGHVDGTAVSAEELGRRQDIPRNFLQAILADLRRADIVMSQRGQAGGWRLARPADAVTVADVIRAVDGPLVSVYGLRPEAVRYNESAEELQRVWRCLSSATRCSAVSTTAASSPRPARRRSPWCPTPSPSTEPTDRARNRALRRKNRPCRTPR